MNIFYLSNEFDQVQTNIFSHLRKIGNTVYPFCYSLKTTSKNSILVDDINYYSCPSFFSGPIFYLKRLKKIANKCLSFLEEKKVDILLGNRLFVDGIIFYYINRVRQIPYVVAFRNTDLNLSFLWNLPWIRNKGVKVIENAHAVICLSSSYKDQLISKLPNSMKHLVDNKIFVIPNGVDPFWINNRCTKGKQIDQDIRLITVGRLEKNKNQITVAKAGEILKRDYPKINYTVVGDIKDDSLYNKLKHFDFVHYVPHKEKAELIKMYRKTDIFVMPSFKESFGLVYAEAMTQGLPVIYTKSQGFDEQFFEGTVGYHVNPDSPSDIAKAIRKVIDNYSSISDNCIKHSLEFDWDSIAKKYVAIFEKAFEEGK